MSLSLDRTAWKRVAFGDVVANLNVTVKDPAPAGISRIIAMEHLDPGELKISRWGDLEEGTSFTRLVRPGQTLFGKRRAYQRKAAYAEFDAICSGDILVFEADPQKVLPEFLPFLVQSDGFYDHALGTSAGSLSPRTNWRDLADYEFDLPPLDEQRRLVKLLSKAEAAKDRLRELEAAISRLKSMQLGQFLEASSRKKKWPTTAVQELLTSGPTNGRSAPANDQGLGTPTLSISAVRRGRVVGGDSIKFVEFGDVDVDPFVLQAKDFLVVRGNGNKNLVGLGGLVSGGLPEGCVYPDLLIRLRWDEEKILSNFAAEQWNAAASHHKLLQKAKSTNGIWKINGKDVRSHALVVPSLREQAAILGKLGVCDEASSKVLREIAELSKTKSAISAEVFGCAS